MKLLRSGLVIFCLFFLSTISQPVYAQSTWWEYATHPFRVPITTVTGSDHALSNKTVEFTINFTQLLSALGQSGTFSDLSIRVTEVDSAGVPKDTMVPFQFDKATSYNAASNASGTFLIYLKDATASGASRYFRIYFGTTAINYPAPVFTPPIVLTDNINFEGQTSVKVSTPKAEYMYHKLGAGFASIKDTAGTEWLGYHPTGGAAGNYRGIPNMVHPEGIFHPGATNSTTTIESSGPLKVALYSQTADGKWKARWDIYPSYAQMTMIAADHPYWFLYEGTPGGSFDAARDYMVTSTNQRYAASSSRATDLPSPEWLYFGDSTIQRTLFLSHTPDDSGIDAYEPMNNSMTVFGFGRNNLNKYLTGTAHIFYIGLVASDTYTVVKSEVESSMTQVTASLGTPESRIGPEPTSTPTPTVTGTPPATPTPTATGTPNTPTPTPTGQQPCQRKRQGDSDCNGSLELADFNIWRTEYFAGCTHANLAACGVDADSDGSLMDANFNYTGSGNMPVESSALITIVDFNIWRTGYFAANTTSIPNPLSSSFHRHDLL